MDHDRLFKELLKNFFAEFIELFLPEVAAQLDRGSIQFVDKEVFTDIGSADRHEVDLLAKVRLLGAEAFILVHVENQSAWQADFPRRMFRYFSLIHSKYDLPVYPIAVFSYDKPLTPAADRYALELFGLPVMRFQFYPIQLNAFSWKDFVKRPNPVASALMVKMRIPVEDRPYVKLECMRMIYTLRLNRARAGLIEVFMNQYLKLNKDEKVVYDAGVQKLAPQEQEFILKIENEWTEIGMAEGMAKGEAKALRTVARRLFVRRFGEFPPEISEAVNVLPLERLEDFIEVVQDLNSMDEAKLWIAKASN